MSHLRRTFRRSTLPLLLVVCLAALTFSYAFADDVSRPLAATDLLGSPDAAVNGKFAVGSAAVGTKAFTVVGVIDFLGAGTVHNYFTQGAGNNMQINTNIDEANAVGDATRSQWKVVLGSNLDQFSIRRSPAGGTYNEDALFFIDGVSGNVGIATVDTSNGATIPFTPLAKLHVETPSGVAVRAVSNDSATGYGVYGLTYGTSSSGVFGYVPSTSGVTNGVYGTSLSTIGRGVYGIATATTGNNYGVYGQSNSTSGTGVFGSAPATTGSTFGVFGQTISPNGYGVYSAGNMVAVGNFTATGTKSAVVDTQDYGWRTLYAVESPQNWFEDFGQATLVNGEATISIDPIFAQTVNLDGDYHVFLTPRGGGCTLYLAQALAAEFTVQANEGSTCGITFDYRIVAPRLDYEGLRLEPAQDPDTMAASLPEAPPSPPLPPTP